MCPGHRCARDAEAGLTLIRCPTGWTLAEGGAAAPAAGLHMTGEAAWRLLTGASYDRSQIWLTGDEALGEPLLRVRGVVVQAV